ncbi:MAG: energy-coupling factor transporter transmembrane component T family protein [Candidatus Brocadia sp.]
MSISPPSTRLGTVLILLVLTGLGLLDNLFCLLLYLLIINVFAVLVARRTFVTVWRCKGVLIFFVLTGATLLWTDGGRSLAPGLITRMLSMWLWVVIWITWVGFERILFTFEKLRAPSVFIHIIAFTARFLPILSERVKTMLAAQASRGAKRGIHPLRLRNLAGGVGCLLLASFEQAENVERAMQSRGFNGTFPFLADDKDIIVVPYGSLIFLFLLTCIVWFGVVCDVLRYPCPEFIFQVSKWRSGDF